MPITIFVSATAGDIAVEWTCDQPALVTRLKQLIQAGFRFITAEHIGRVAGEVAAEGVRVRDRDVAGVIKAGLVRVIDIQGGWETKTADPLTAEEAAVSNAIAIRAAPIRSSRRRSVEIEVQDGGRRFLGHRRESRANRPALQTMGTVSGQPVV